MSTESLLNQIEQAIGFPLTRINDIEAYLQAHYPQSYRDVMSPADEMVGSMHSRTAFLDREGRLVGLNFHGCKLSSEQLRFLQELDLPHLQALNVGGNALTTFSLSRNLTSLEVADLSQNETLHTLSCESGLEALTRLELYKCDLRKLVIPSIWRSLAYLDLGQNKQFEEITFLGNCPELNTLFLRGTSLKSFRLREGFGKLTHLFLNNNKLTHFEVQGDSYPSLQTLSLRDNLLSEVPVEILRAMPQLDALYLGNNKDLPRVLYAEIEEKKDQSHLTEFKRYADALAQGEPTLNKECKVLLIGNGGAGKTNLASRLAGGPFNPEWDSTHGILLKQQPLGIYKINYWDFGGQHIYHSTHRLFMQKDAVYLLAWRPETEPKPDPAPFEYHDKNHPLHYWLDYVRSLGDNSPVLVVQTQAGRGQENVQPLAEELKDKYKPLFSLFEEHAVESDNRGFEADEVFDHNSGYVKLREEVQRAVGQILPPGDLIPLPYYRLRELIRAEQAKGLVTMTYGEYLNLAKSLEAENLRIEDPRALLEGWLFKSGVVYFRPSRFSNQIILNQSWAIDAIYTLFNRRAFLDEVQDEVSIPAMIERKRGIFSGKFLRQIWDKKGYSHEHQEVFVGFMKSCDLCFEIETEGKEVAFEDRVFMAPQLLPDIPPVKADSRLREPDVVHYQYTHRFLHEGVIQAFLARTAYVADLDSIWRRGVQISEGEGKQVQIASVEAHAGHIDVFLTPNAGLLLAKVRDLLARLQEGSGVETIGKIGQPLQPLEMSSGLLTSLKSNMEFSDLPLVMEESSQQGAEIKETTFAANESAKLPPEAFAEKQRSAQAPAPEKMILFCSASPRYPAEVPNREGSQATSFVTVATQPSDFGVIRSMDEYKEAFFELVTLDKLQYFGFIDMIKSAELRDLQVGLFKKPAIVHFCGHGDPSGLVLENASGAASLLNTDLVSRLFDNLRGITELVILNACYSAPTARAISGFGIYVVGTCFEVKEKAAISFAKGFYRGLGLTRDYREAFNHAMLNVDHEHPESGATYKVWFNGEPLAW